METWFNLFFVIFWDFSKNVPEMWTILVLMICLIFWGIVGPKWSPYVAEVLLVTFDNSWTCSSVLKTFSSVPFLGNYYWAHIHLLLCEMPLQPTSVNAAASACGSLPAGLMCRYASDKYGWICCQILRAHGSDGAYDLDVQERALPDKVAPVVGKGERYIWPAHDEFVSLWRHEFVSIGRLI